MKYILPFDDWPPNLTRDEARGVERIHNQLRADVSHNQGEIQSLVCRAIQECFDFLKRIHCERGLELTDHVRKEQLPQLVFDIAIHSGWLPDWVRADNLMWMDWVRRLCEGRYSRTRSGECDPFEVQPYLFVEFPVNDRVPTTQTRAIDSAIAENPTFPKRAEWLKDRLRKLAWNHNSLHAQGGPDRKTVLKILAGKRVREGVLEKLAESLSKKGTKVEPADIPDR